MRVHVRRVYRGGALLRLLLLTTADHRGHTREGRGRGSPPVLQVERLRPS